MNVLLSQITPSRSFNLTFVLIDIAFLLVLTALLLYKRRYQTCLFGLFGGILYTIVDYCGFYLLAHSREIYLSGELADPLMTFWVLLWMSMSYGFTNFAFIWLCLSKDKYLALWLSLIVGWWLVAPSIASLGGEATIFTTRTTNEYHGIMGVFLAVSYLALIALMLVKKRQFVNILFLNLIGISVQFGWEFALLINGIRPMNELSIQTLLVNSFMETNLGIPAILGIFYLVRKKRDEDLKPSSGQFGILRISREEESLTGE